MSVAAVVLVKTYLTAAAVVLGVCGAEAGILGLIFGLS